MKYIYLLSILLLTSCVNTKSTLQNIDYNAVQPKIKNNAFILTEYAEDSNYGYNENFPVNIGPISKDLEELYVKYYFNGLLGPNGEKIEYLKTDTCCPFPTEKSPMGAGTLSVYEVKWEGTEQKKTLYFNVYEKGKVVCPKGMKINTEIQN